VQSVGGHNTFLVNFLKKFQHISFSLVKISDSKNIPKNGTKSALSRTPEEIRSPNSGIWIWYWGEHSRKASSEKSHWSHRDIYPVQIPDTKNSPSMANFGIFPVLLPSPTQKKTKWNIGKLLIFNSHFLDFFIPPSLYAHLRI